MEEKYNSSHKDVVLDELLDCALGEFEQPSENTVTSTQKSTSKESVSDEAGSKDKYDLSEEKIIAEMENGFKKVQALLEQVETNDPSKEDFQQIVEAAANMISNVESSNSFEATIASTLKNLSESTDNIQGDLSSMFGELGLGECNEDFDPFIEQMMQSLLSKDILYPPIKDLVCNKYPDWLAANSTSLPPDECNRVRAQFNLMSKVCETFENEKEADSKEEKKHRLNTVLGYIEELQKLGPLPEALLPDDAMNMKSMMGNTPCCIM